MAANSLRTNEDVPTELPPGVKLLRTLEESHSAVFALAIDPKGRLLASGAQDGTVNLWDAQGGKPLPTPTRHYMTVWRLAFNPQGRLLVSGAIDGTVNLWDVQSGKPLPTPPRHYAPVWGVAFDTQGRLLASGAQDGTVNLWDAQGGKPLPNFKRHYHPVHNLVFDRHGRLLAFGIEDGRVNIFDAQSGAPLTTTPRSYPCSVAFDPHGRLLASGNKDGIVNVWDAQSGKLRGTLEGHTGRICTAAFSQNGRLLASVSDDDTIRLWSCKTWDTVAILPAPKASKWLSVVGVHPKLLLLAAGNDKDNLAIQLWELDLDVLLGQLVSVAAAERAVHHTTAKIVLVGDHSVGKSALGYRLIHGTFKEQASTHGQQFWVFPALGQRRMDGTECEAILWDFAGQPDYRLVHALFVDDADLALVLFDASDLRDPLHGVGFWLKQLQAGQSRRPIILVAAQTDRGTCSLTPEELSAFCEKQGILGPVATSSLTGVGFDQLVERMKSMIPWDDKPATVTTTTFKKIKDYVLRLKEAGSDGQIVVAPEKLRGSLEATDAGWHFTDAQMLTAVGHLENYGYVKRLRTSKGEQRILLQPERLNNLASSFVLKARRNPKGLGALEEKRLLSGGYDFPELTHLRNEERDVLLDSAALLFLEHNVCFRETDPLRLEPYLVFPELINLKKPPEQEVAVEDGVAYEVSGPTENVFASLVVLLGYTHTFTRTAQWRNNARYEVGDGLACGFRQEAERDGELDFVLCFGAKVGLPVRTLFQGLFESFLARRNLTVMRFEPVYCSNGHLLERSVVRRWMKERKAFAFCNDCGEKLMLPKMAEPIQLAREVQSEVELQRRAAEQRTRFEQAVFRLRAYVAEQKTTPPKTFISYAWGVPEHERWVEKQLATDLQKAGIEIVLDRWSNAQIGASVPRFIERIGESKYVIVVGTKLYRKKYENKEPMRGYVAAAEGDLIGKRMIETEAQKESVLPVLLEGTPEAAFPPLLHGRVYADFREEHAYFKTAFELILSLYRLPPNHPAVSDLRESLPRRELG
jgi:small GTP-binding protein